MNKKENYNSSVLDKRMLSEKEARVYLGLGRTKTRELCKDIKAVTHIGTRVLYDRTVIDSYLNNVNRGIKE